MSLSALLRSLLQPGYWMSREDQIEVGGQKLPWGRMGQPEEIAKAVTYVLSDDADYMTGSTLTIDGGVSLPWWSNRGSGEM